jgi:peptidoglycan hydrolase FlgJ
MALPAPTPAVTDLGALASLRASARANDPESVRKAAQQFEALFTQQLLKSARAANLGDDVLGGGQTEFYQDLFDQQMALHLSTGKGIGLAEVLVRQMIGTQANAATAGTVTGRDFTDYRPVTALAQSLAESRRAHAGRAGRGDRRAGGARDRMGPSCSAPRGRHPELQLLRHQGRRLLERRAADQVHP